MQSLSIPQQDTDVPIAVACAQRWLAEAPAGVWILASQLADEARPAVRRALVDRLFELTPVLGDWARLPRLFVHLGLGTEVGRIDALIADRRAETARRAAALAVRMTAPGAAAVLATLPVLDTIAISRPWLTSALRRAGLGVAGAAERIADVVEATPVPHRAAMIGQIERCRADSTTTAIDAWGPALARASLGGDRHRLLHHVVACGRGDAAERLAAILDTYDARTVGADRIADEVCFRRDLRTALQIIRSDSRARFRQSDAA